MRKYFQFIEDGKDYGRLYQLDREGDIHLHIDGKAYHKDNKIYFKSRYEFINIPGLEKKNRCSYSIPIISVKI